MSIPPQFDVAAAVASHRVQRMAAPRDAKTRQAGKGKAMTLELPIVRSIYERHADMGD